jgi:hypothetical protein
MALSSVHNSATIQLRASNTAMFIRPGTGYDDQVQDVPEETLLCNCVKVKLLVKHYAMKTYRGVEV